MFWIFFGNDSQTYRLRSAPPVEWAEGVVICRRLRLMYSGRFCLVPCVVAHSYCYDKEAIPVEVLDTNDGKDIQVAEAVEVGLVLMVRNALAGGLSLRN